MQANPSPGFYHGPVWAEFRRAEFPRAVFRDNMLGEDCVEPIEKPAESQLEVSADREAPRYRLPVFEGPLDLLLYLIQKNEIEIKDIPILLITEQYGAYLEQMRELDLDVAADYILMAATLIHIKSRMLLPVLKEAEGEQAFEDPRQPLVTPEHARMVMQVYQAADKSAEEGRPIDLDIAEPASHRRQRRNPGSIKHVAADRT
jgi:chromatin segregation and condensation protein Rec8/ScpA/Scc1 (kleisin family)